MKFISKSANLNIILRPGMQAQPLTGTPAKATIFVRFKDGIADVEDEELVKMMMIHDGFERDFVAADEKGTDIYAHQREHEVQYVTEELVHGQAKRIGTPLVKRPMSPEIKKMINDQAISIAKEMLPDMVKAVLESAQKLPKADTTVPEVAEVKPKTVSKTTKETAKTTTKETTK